MGGWCAGGDVWVGGVLVGLCGWVECAGGAVWVDGVYWWGTAWVGRVCWWVGCVGGWSVLVAGLNGGSPWSLDSILCFLTTGSFRLTFPLPG